MVGSPLWTSTKADHSDAKADKGTRKGDIHMSVEVPTCLPYKYI
jgi:hypothetical protein